MKLSSLGKGAGFLKAGFLGFAGSGKTYTAALLACGTAKRFGLDGRIAMMDTEGGAQYIAPLIRERTGNDLIGHQSRSLSDAVDFLKECERERIDVAIIDSVTHLWRELCDSYLSQVNDSLTKNGRNPRKRLELSDWGPIKSKWGEFSDAYLNSKLHVIISGRAGWDWDWQYNEATDRKELVKTGVKMKTEGEFGYEPSLLVEMERIQFDSETKVIEKAVTHRATVLKDRFGDLDAKQFDNPGFEFFAPHVSRLIPGAVVVVNTESQTPFEVDEKGNADWARERKEKEILLEKIQNEILIHYPGQSAQEKKAKVEIVFRVFDTKSWSEVEMMSVDGLRRGLSKLPEVLQSYKHALESEQEVQKHFVGESLKSRPKVAVKAGKE